MPLLADPPEGIRCVGAVKDRIQENAEPQTPNSKPNGERGRQLLRGTEPREDRKDRSQKSEVKTPNPKLQTANAKPRTASPGPRRSSLPRADGHCSCRPISYKNFSQTAISAHRGPGYRVAINQFVLHESLHRRGRAGDPQGYR